MFTKPARNMMKMSSKLFILLLIFRFASVSADGQEQPKLIGDMEFFGYATVELDKIKTALPFHKGDPFNMEIFAAKFEQAGESVKRFTGRTPTDIASVCCDGGGNWLIFIGLSGVQVPHQPPPKGTSRLPEEMLKLYDQFIQTNTESVQRGASREDYSTGYALSTDPPLRSIQLQMRAFALAHAALIGRVLRDSADERQRIAAAQLMGYARQSRSQIAALVEASRDSSSGVRNNATRALIMLAKSSPKIAARIPVESFVGLLLSGKWTDLNKAGNLLDAITESRNPRHLVQLRREKIIERLIEMARWGAGYGDPARFILGRVAGIEENRLKQLVSAGQVEEIIQRLGRK